MRWRLEWWLIIVRSCWRFVIVMRSVRRFLIFVISRSPMRFFVIVNMDDILYWWPVVTGDRFRLDDILDTARIGWNSDPRYPDTRVPGGRTADDGSLLLVLLVWEATLSKYIGHVKPSLCVRSLLPVRPPVRGGL